MELKLRDINDSFAREILGIKLWSELDNSTIDSLANALSTIGVLVFRRQSLSEEELVAFTSKFGQLEIQVKAGMTG